MNDTQTEDKLFEQLDREKITSEIADKVKEEAVAAARDQLVSQLTDKKARYSWEEKGKKAPSDYDELFGEIEKKTLRPEQVEEMLENKLKEKEERERKLEEKKREQEIKEIENKKKSFDQEWYDLVQAGKMPAPSEEIQEKINRGDKLTAEEIKNDEGLKRRLELANIAFNNNKSAKVAFYEDLNKEPAGTKAPVFGSRGSAPNTTSEDDYTLEDVRELRKQMGI